MIHLFHNSTVCVMNSRVSGQRVYTLLYSYKWKYSKLWRWIYPK